MPSSSKFKIPLKQEKQNQTSMFPLRTLRRFPPSILRYSPPFFFPYTSLPNPNSSETLEQPPTNDPIPDQILIKHINNIIHTNLYPSPSSQSYLNPQIIVKLIYKCSENQVLSQHFVNFLLQLKNFNHSNTSLSAMIHILVKNNRHHEARVLISKLMNQGTKDCIDGVDSLIDTYNGCRSSIEVFDNLIISLVKEKKLVEAVETFRVLKSRGFVIGVKAFNVLLAELVNARVLIDMAFDVFGEFVESEMEKNVFTMNIMVRALCKLLRYEDIPKVLLAMEKKGVFADTVTYATVINERCYRGHPEEAIRILCTMEDKGLRAGIEVYAKIVNCLCWYKPEEYTSAEITLEDMQVKLGNILHGPAPTIVSFTLLIGFLLRSGETDRALVYYREMQNYELVPDSVIYTMLIGRLCRNGKSVEAHKMFDEMVERGCLPDVIMYNIVLNGFCKEKRLDQAEDIFAEMIRRVPPDYYSYTTLIHGYCNEGDVEKALSWFRKMDKFKKKLEFGRSSILNILNTWVCKDSDMESLNELWDDVKSKGLSPRYVSYSILINALCGKGNSINALNLFYNMLKEGIRPNILTCNSVFKGYCLLGNSKKPDKFLNKMISSGITPDATTYTTLIEVFVKEEKMHSALNLINKMRSQNLVLDVTTFNFVLNGFCQKCRMQEAEQLFRCMIEKGPEPDKLTYKSLIAGYTSQGNLKEAFRYHGEMLQKGFLR